MVGLFFAIISVLATWLGLGLIFVGLGLGLRRLYGLATLEAEGLFTAFWLGWALILGFLQLWHLLLPVDWRALAVVTALGLAGLIFTWQELWHLFKKRAPGKGLFLLLFLLAALWTADHAILLPMFYDSGLYHLHAVRWATSYPVVPGLGNLHIRLGFNISYFLYVALLEVGPWVQRSQHLANGLLILALLGQILLSAFKILKNIHGRVAVHHIFLVMFLPAALKMAAHFFVASPSPDLPVFVLGVVLSAALLRYAFDAESGYEERGFDLFCISLMAAVGLIVKLNFLVLGLGALVAALVIWFSKHGRGDKLKDSSPLVWVTLGVAIIWLPWMVQGVITSGYPFCPLSFGAFQVDWRIPQENLTEHMDWIRSWARAPGMEPGKVLTNWDWLKPWFGEMLKTDEGRLNLVTPAVLTFIFAGLGLYGRLTAKDKINIPALSWLFLLYPLASILFWFVTAPDPRYVGAGFWILAAGAGALAIAGFEDRPNPLMTPLLALCLALALSIIFLDKPLKPSKKRQTTFNVPPPG